MRVLSAFFFVAFFAVVTVGCTKSKNPSDLVANPPTCPLPGLCSTCPDNNWGLCYKKGIWTYQTVDEAISYPNNAYGPPANCPSSAYYCDNVYLEAPVSFSTGGNCTPNAGLTSGQPGTGLAECWGRDVTPAWSPEYSYGTCEAAQEGNFYCTTSSSGTVTLTAECVLTAASACTCPVQGQTYCGTAPTAACTDTSIDDNNCGACGTICSTGQTCTAGVCVTPPLPHRHVFTTVGTYTPGKAYDATMSPNTFVSAAEGNLICQAEAKANNWAAVMADLQHSAWDNIQTVGSGINASDTRHVYLVGDKAKVSGPATNPAVTGSFTSGVGFINSPGWAYWSGSSLINGAFFLKSSSGCGTVTGWDSTTGEGDIGGPASGCFGREKYLQGGCSEGCSTAQNLLCIEVDL